MLETKKKCYESFCPSIFERVILQRGPEGIGPPDLTQPHGQWQWQRRGGSFSPDTHAATS